MEQVSVDVGVSHLAELGNARQWLMWPRVWDGITLGKGTDVMCLGQMDGQGKQMMGEGSMGMDGCMDGQMGG